MMQILKKNGPPCVSQIRVSNEDIMAKKIFGFKPIETVWNGYRFRSRTEARWAVFFTHLNMPFEYEKEGFRLEDGTFYLPDFWLPDLSMWLEIKGAPPSDDEITKAELLCSGNGNPVGIFHGLPGENQGIVIANSIFGCGGGRIRFDDVDWGTTTGGKLGLALWLKSERILNEDIVICDDRWLTITRFNEQYFPSGPFVESASIAARSARFEFGQKP